jgi:transcriptional regulator with XRE-family HTH domain
MTPKPTTLGSRCTGSQPEGKQLGDVVRAARMHRGVSQTALAEQLNVSPKTISAIERNERTPSLHMLHLILASLQYRLILQPAEEAQVSHEALMVLLRKMASDFRSLLLILAEEKTKD